MRSHTLSPKPLLFCLHLILAPGLIKAQDLPSQIERLEETILHYDSLFWEAYNGCDVQGMKRFLTDDVEFYHDRSGLTTSNEAVMRTVRTNLCSNPEWRLRREAIAESIKVYPLEQYGAILSGEHVFYIRERGKEERLDGLAKFTHVWRYKGNEWKMHRILSYDHGPAPYRSSRKEIPLPLQHLQQHTGKYQAPKSGIITVALDGNMLKLIIGDFEQYIYPQSHTRFFVKDRDLEFEFVKEKQQIEKLVVYENGKLVEEARRMDAN